jgi:hypothetical protein
MLLANATTGAFRCTLSSTCASNLARRLASPATVTRIRTGDATFNVPA